MSKVSNDTFGWAAPLREKLEGEGEREGMERGCRCTKGPTDGHSVDILRHETVGTLRRGKAREKKLSDCVTRKT